MKKFLSKWMWLMIPVTVFLAGGAIAGEDGRLMVYPNPAGASLRVKATRTIKVLLIYSMDGKLIKKIVRPDIKDSISIQALNTGSYVLHATFEDGKKASAIVIKR
jgi:hypothetical protein